eukprot:1312791-Prymnesium_polylepis.1
MGVTDCKSAVGFSEHDSSLLSICWWWCDACDVRDVGALHVPRMRETAEHPMRKLCFVWSWSGM